MTAQPEASDDRSIIGCLEALIDDPELAELEANLDEFNAFEILGAVRQEINHSNFLAFLLDPTQSHRLGDRFLKSFLKRATRGAAAIEFSLSALNLDVIDLDEAEVYREWHDIDILIIDRENKLALIIENKIGSSLHDNQLNRYFETVTHNFTGYKAIGIYLTPSGSESNDVRFLTVGYKEVADVLDSLVVKHGRLMDPGAALLAKHYCSMLRRHILEKQDISELCFRLYQRHRRAFDEVFKTRLDRVSWIADLLKTLIKADANLILDDGDKGYIRFAPLAWEKLNWVDEDRTWTSSGRILLFEFGNWPQGLKFKLIIGPGPIDTRQRLLDVTLAHQPPFKPSGKKLNQKWNSVYARDFVPARVLEDGTDDEVRSHIEKQWEAFRSGELRSILAAIETVTPISP